MSWLDRWAVLGMLQTEGVAVAPWDGGLHPGGRIGLEARWSGEDGPVAIVQRVHVGAFVHPSLQATTSLLTELAVRPSVGPVGLDLSIGAGGLLSNVTHARFGDERPYEPRGRIDADLAALVGVGLDVSATDRIAAFARYELLAAGPFGLLGNPVLPHRTLGVGLRVVLGGGR